MSVALDPAKMRLVKTVPKDNVGFWCAALDPATQHLFTGGTDCNIHVYDLPAVQPNTMGPLKQHTSYVTSLVFLPQEQVLISGGFDKQLIWWKASSGEPVRRITTDGRVNHLAATADGRRIGVATNELTARIWDTRTANPVVELRGGHPPTTYLGRHNVIYCIAFSPNGQRVATGDRAGTIAFWETSTGKLLYKATASAFYSHASSQVKQASEYEWGGVRALAFTPDGKMLAAGGMGPADQNSAGIDGPMRLEVFDVVTGKSLAALMGAPKGMLLTLLFQPGGDWLIAGGGGGQAGSAGVGSLWLWNDRQLDKDRKPVPPVMRPTAIVVREVLLNQTGDTLLAVGMQRDLTAGRIEAWELTPPATAPTKLKQATK
jgi:WD40 repeat protein